MAFGTQLICCLHGDLHLRAGSDEDQIRLAVALLQNIAAAGDGFHLLRGTLHLGKVLTGEDQRGRAVVALNRQLPADGGFNLVTGAPGAEVWRQAQAGELLNRLVRRAIFPQADGVMGVDHDLAGLHQRCHARGVTRVLNEHQEGGGVGDEAAVVGDAVGNGGHAELTHAVVNVVPGQVLF